jgi:hypothetical protein
MCVFVCVCVEYLHDFQKHIAVSDTNTTRVCLGHEYYVCLSETDTNTARVCLGHEYCACLSRTRILRVSVSPERGFWACHDAHALKYHLCTHACPPIHTCMYMYIHMYTYIQDMNTDTYILVQ